MKETKKMAREGKAIMGGNQVNMAFMGTAVNGCDRGTYINGTDPGLGTWFYGSQSMSSLIYELIIEINWTVTYNNIKGNVTLWTMFAHNVNE